ncbi:hypothetical protein [Corallococcus carmarthensis]|uniref:hypothetical protein n=1 Tax=Corallococcus carmarthensis TaxID=2316728 RepID=UPI0011C49BA8|nr:hypothetical protein [Corallococcus carmarthensis]
MRRTTLVKSVGLVLGAGMLFLACGPEAAQEAPPTPQSAKTDDRVRAMTPPDSCNPAEDPHWCPVPSNKYTCFDGVQMDAIWTPDGWCLNSDACRTHGGPWGCPEEW